MESMGRDGSHASAGFTDERDASTLQFEGWPRTAGARLASASLAAGACPGGLPPDAPDCPSQMVWGSAAPSAYALAPEPATW